MLHFIPDEEYPYDAVKALMNAMPTGSYLLLTHGTGDFLTPELMAAPWRLIRSDGTSASPPPGNALRREAGLPTQQMSAAEDLLSEPQQAGREYRS